VTWGTWGGLGGDTGYDFVAATRTAHGELPYVDYTYYYGPLAPALLGLAAWIGGASVGTFVAVGLAVAFATTGAAYALARRYAGPLGAALAAAIVLPVALGPGQTGFVLPHSSDATFGSLAIVLLLLALARYRGRPAWLAAAGIAAGLATLTKPEFALAALVACVAWLLVRRARPREWALLLGPAAAVPAAVYGFILTRISLHELVYANLNPRDFLHAAGNVVLRARTPWTAGSVASLGSKLVLYALGAATLLAAARLLARGGAARRAMLAVLVLAGVTAAAESIRNPEALRHGLQYAYGWIPAGALVALVLLLRRRRRNAWSALPALAALAVLAGTTYATFFPYAWKAQMATYAVPLAAPFLARLHLVELARSRQAAVLGAAWLAFLAVAGIGLTVRDARAESGSVHGPGGTLRTQPALATAYQHVADAIAVRTRPGEAVLLAPQMSWLYTLADRADPVREISLLPGMLAGNGREQAAIARLERARVRLAVVDRQGYPDFDHTFFGGSFDRRIDAWVRAHFTRIAHFNTGGDIESPQLEIWLRRNA
jgi:4-amino-4-deoxy-L-arabinose transferase-like glycosyltransferase